MRHDRRLLLKTTAKHTRLRYISRAVEAMGIQQTAISNSAIQTRSRDCRLQLSQAKHSEMQLLKNILAFSTVFGSVVADMQTCLSQTRLYAPGRASGGDG